jgi:glycosyltransferase domain-containing protein
MDRALRSVTENYSDGITIIIPTYNRPKFLERAMSFWASYNCQIIVVDGSGVAFKNAKEIEGFGNIRYIHSLTSIEDRILFASSIVETEFVAMLPDDEFYLPSALETAKNILKARIDVSFVAGATIGFFGAKGQLFTKHQYEGDYELVINSDSALRRIGQRFESTDSTIYFGLRRLKDFREVISFACAKKYSCPYIHEIQVETATLLQGKIHFIKELMWLRCHEAPPISNNTFNRDYSVADWFSDEKMQAERECFNQTLNNFMSLTSRESVIADYVLQMYMSRDKKHSAIGGWTGESLVQKLKRTLGEMFQFVLNGEFARTLFMICQRGYGLFHYRGIGRGYTPLWLTMLEMKCRFGIVANRRELSRATSIVNQFELSIVPSEESVLSSKA